MIVILLGLFGGIIVTMLTNSIWGIILGFAFLFLYGGLARVTVKAPSWDDKTKQKINNALIKQGKTSEECRNALRHTVEVLKEKENSLMLFYAYVDPFLKMAIEALNNGQFEDAGGYFKKAQDSMKDLKSRIPEEFDDLSRKFSVLMYNEEIYVYKYNLSWNLYSQLDVQKSLNFAARACDALYLGDVEKMRELLSKARKMLDECDKFVIGDVKFFKYLFEFHYFLLKTVVEAYEAETGAVTKLTEEQAKRFAEAKPVEVPTTVEKVSVSAEEPEEELYRGEVRFKIGAISQERVGTLVITNKRLKLTGKYRLRGMVATVAVKAALRAAGVSEVYEDIPLKEISWLELKKALLGGYYLEFRARGKKFTLYTDAAQHIYNILRQYSNA